MRLALVALALCGCLRSTQFTCELDSDCGGGSCEPTGFCSFLDPACASGSRYGELSGSLSNQCVDDGLLPDAAPDGPAVCPGYELLAGAPNSYRLISNRASWTDMRDNCAGDGGYLAIPNDLAELTALVTRAGGGTAIWVGLTDTATENTFLTVLGAPAPFLPWDTGEPNGNPAPADCVRATTTFETADDRCSTDYDAVCECGPP